MNKRIKVGINGFGRIGRTIFRVNHLKKFFDIVAVNDINDNIENLAYLLKYDTIHGTIKDEISVKNKKIIVGGDEVSVFSENHIEDVQWDKMGVDIVIGCTGLLRNVKNAGKCIRGSVKKIVFSDSPADVDFTLVLGVNEEKYLSNEHRVVAASICDVIGTAPLLKKIDSEFRIKSGFLLTMHPWLFYQNLLDGQPKSTAFMDKPWTYHAIGRASTGNLIPKNTSVVIALNRILPDIAKRLECMSYRVPTDLVSNCNYSLILEKTVNNETLKSYLKSIVNKPIMGYTEEPLVSSDYKHYDYSLVIDGKWTEVNSDNLLRLVSWYDNEWGYSSRVLDVVNYISNYF